MNKHRKLRLRNRKLPDSASTTVKTRGRRKSETANNHSEQSADVASDKLAKNYTKSDNLTGCPKASYQDKSPRLQATPRIAHNHRFYCSKKRKFPFDRSESFILPDNDDPIFSNDTSHCDELESVPPLDTQNANPLDICVTALDLIDRPWLVENPEVITPYWDIGSLFPVQMDDIRHKSAPDDVPFSSESEVNWGNNEDECGVMVSNHSPMKQKYVEENGIDETPDNIHRDNKIRKVVKSELIKKYYKNIDKPVMLNGADSNDMDLGYKGEQNGVVHPPNLKDTLLIDVYKDWQINGSVIKSKKLNGFVNKTKNPTLQMFRESNILKDTLSTDMSHNSLIETQVEVNQLLLSKSVKSDQSVVLESEDNSHALNSPSLKPDVDTHQKDSGKKQKNSKASTNRRVLKSSDNNYNDKDTFKTSSSSHTSIKNDGIEDTFSVPNIILTDIGLDSQNNTFIVTHSPNSTDTYSVSMHNYTRNGHSKISFNNLPTKEGPIELSEQNSSKIEDKVMPVLEIKQEPKDFNFSLNEDEKSSESSIATFDKDVEIKEEEESEQMFNEGDFVWAQVGKFPYWPAIICDDPFEHIYWQNVLKRKNIKKLYHLRFFGDYGRRAWVNESNLMMYQSKNDLEIIANKLKSESKNFTAIKPFIVTSRSNYCAKWEIGIEELESIKNKPFREILKHLLDTAEKRLEEKRQNRKHKLSCTVPPTESGPMEPLPQMSRTNDIFVTSQMPKLELHSDVVETDIETKELEVNPHLERSNINLRRSERSLKAAQSPKEEPKVVEITSSDNDSVSTKSFKRSTQPNKIDPSIFTFEYQLELHKKNNLFAGLSNVKVCQHCLKQGDLYKCKGRCMSFYHLECASKVGIQSIKRKQEKREKIRRNPRPRQTENCCVTRSQNRCEIVTVKSKHDTPISTPCESSLPENFNEMSIGERIDHSMKEIMSHLEKSPLYDSADSGSEAGSSKYWETSIGPNSPSSRESVQSDIKGSSDEYNKGSDASYYMSGESTLVSFKHVTADSILLRDDEEETVDVTILKCTFCRLEKDPPCFSCGLEVTKKGESFRQKCSNCYCGRFYHPQCLKGWPQTQWSIGKWSKTQQSEDNFSCPAHKCHTCFSEELGANGACRMPGDKLARCLLCPSAFHATTFCIPAGSDILGALQIVCPRHTSKSVKPMNTVWCFICAEGGNLVCCDTCPTSVHPECQPINFTDDDKYICEDCESGRFPLYDEIVWVRLGQYPWWPGIVLFPNEVPANVRNVKHGRGDFVVKFFGTHDYYWVNRARVFLFQDGDDETGTQELARSKFGKKLYESLESAIKDAVLTYKLKKEFKERQEAENIDNAKPPTFTKINKNRPVGNVKYTELDLSNATACECDPNKPQPCGPDSSCINRLLLTECDPDICPAGVKCGNQAFQRREYPLLTPYKTRSRGWGLKTLASISRGEFIIEYVGELIDNEEYQRRIKKMHEKKEENYYFMTVDGDRLIDAGPKGNVSRFMNHSCNPNCVTQKWTVKGDTRVGLFANCDIEAGSELTFNYNLEVVGQEKKICLCGAPNCSGFIGGKPKSEKSQFDNSSQSVLEASHKVQRTHKKKKDVAEPTKHRCFVCEKETTDLVCNNKMCGKAYHLTCLQEDEIVEASKFVCLRHKCRICSNRTIRCCVRCINSFCPTHSESNIRYDVSLGFVCRLHDPAAAANDPAVPVSESLIATETPLFTLPKKSNKFSALSKTANIAGQRTRQQSRKMPINSFKKRTETSLSEVGRSRTRSSAQIERNPETSSSISLQDNNSYSSEKASLTNSNKDRMEELNQRRKTLRRRQTTSNLSPTKDIEVDDLPLSQRLNRSTR